MLRKSIPFTLYKNIFMIFQTFVMIGLTSISSLGGVERPLSLFELDTTSIEVEESLRFLFVNDGDFLVHSYGAAQRTPAVYLGKVRVTPGKQYSYLVRGKTNSLNGIALYVISNSGNIVWPGNKLEAGIAMNTFVIPENVDEITVALVFMYPLKDDYVLISDIVLIEGAINPMDWAVPTEKKYSRFKTTKKSDKNNLLKTENFLIKKEKGVDFSFVKHEGTDYLIVRSTGIDNGTPSIYFATYEVEPEKTYSYIVRGKSIKNCSLSLYVLSSEGNIVWPGSRVENGFAKSTFQVPPNVHSITLGMAFVYAANNEFLLIEDINLFQGDVDPWSWEKSSDTGLSPIITSHTQSGQSWKRLAFIFSVLLPIFLYFVYKRQKSNLVNL